MSRGRGREGIGEGRRESCEAPPAQERGEELGVEGAKGPQAESTLTYALPSLVSKWFTGIGCQGSPGFRPHFDLVCLPVRLICGHPVKFTIVKGSCVGYADCWTIQVTHIHWISSNLLSHRSRLENLALLTIPPCANFLIPGAAAHSRKTRWNGAVKPILFKFSHFTVAVFTHFSNSLV